ncbi:MAG: M23 family metallopeptidase [bacterium]
MAKDNRTPTNKALDEGIEKGSELGGSVAGAGIGALAGAGVAAATGGAAIPLIKSGADIGAGIGKDVGNAVGKVGKMARQSTEYIGNPLEAILDKSIKLIVDFLIPVPILGEYTGDLVAKYKGQIGLIIVGVVLVVSFLLFGNTRSAGNPNNYEGLPPELYNYIEEGFTDTGTPQHSPFGGTGTTNTVITSYFMDPNYYKHYGRWHKALDLIPNYNYYKNNKAYQLTKKPIMFATCSGKAQGKQDGAGGNYIMIYCKGGKYKTMSLHNSVNFIPYGKEVDIVAGQPIAIMGETGMADGAHIHYAIWEDGQPVNPLPFLNN